MLLGWGPGFKVKHRFPKCGSQATEGSTWQWVVGGAFVLSEMKNVCSFHFLFCSQLFMLKKRPHISVSLSLNPSWYLLISHFIIKNRSRAHSLLWETLLSYWGLPKKILKYYCLTGVSPRSRSWGEDYIRAHSLFSWLRGNDTEKGMKGSQRGMC